MPLSLTVDTGPWTDHLRAVAAARPGLVPVCKGNGYGFGLTELIRVATDVLEADLVAIGTEAELAELAELDCDVLVLTPDPSRGDPARDAPARPGPAAGPPASRVIRTASTVADVRRLIAAGQRFVVECRTDLQRHGVDPGDFAELAGLLATSGAAGFEGWGMHLPLAGAGTWGGWVRGRVAALQGAGLPVATLFVSHLGARELAELRAALPGTRVRPRLGTDLWLGRRDVLHPVATVLDVHRLPGGTPAGYWQRRTPAAGAIVVVSGGTAHGIGLAAPPPPATRRRAAALASAVADTVGHLRSPYSFEGRALRFHEPPHMQVSLLWLPASRRGRPARLPERGTALDVRVRYTTTLFDVVQLTS